MMTHTMLKSIMGIIIIKVIVTKDIILMVKVRTEERIARSSYSCMNMMITFMHMNIIMEASKTC